MAGATLHTPTCERAASNISRSFKIETVSIRRLVTVHRSSILSTGEANTIKKGWLHEIRLMVNEISREPQISAAKFILTLRMKVSFHHKVNYQEIAHPVGRRPLFQPGY